MAKKRLQGYYESKQLYSKWNLAYLNHHVSYVRMPLQTNSLWLNNLKIYKAMNLNFSEFVIYTLGAGVSFICKSLHTWSDF